MNAPRPAELASALAAVMRALDNRGLNHGRAGNASARAGSSFLVTPSGVKPSELDPGAMVTVPLAATTPPPGASSEWLMHADIYRRRPEVGAVVHAHSPYATALACARREVPAFHYMVAVAGGDSIRCAPYATFGTEALSAATVAALQDRKACLLANHGLVALGADLTAALDMAVEVEALCQQYWLTIQIGGAEILSNRDMTEVLEKFETYGRER